MTTWLSQLRHQVGFDLLMFRRNPAATFFTVAMPLIFFVIFTTIFGNQRLDNGVRQATYFVPGLLALSITSATMVNLAMTMTVRRERGVVKRVRGTPLPPVVFIAAQALAGVVISLVTGAVLIGAGWALFDVSVRAEGVISLGLSIIIGASCLAPLGLALTAVIPSENAAPAVTNATVLPLYFISDVFIVGDKPAHLERIAEFFPIQHLAAALVESFDPELSGVPWPWQHWIVLGLWGLVGLALTIAGFRWTPRR